MYVRLWGFARAASTSMAQKLASNQRSLASDLLLTHHDTVLIVDIGPPVQGLLPQAPKAAF